MEPGFLTLAEVLEIHDDQIGRYGGQHGVRDIVLLRSAVEMPQSGHAGGFFHADLFEMAAAYLFHIVMNHPFIDGNKRAGAVAAVVFLDLNGIELNMDEEGFERAVLDVVEGKMGEESLAGLLKSNSKS